MCVKQRWLIPAFVPVTIITDDFVALTLSMPQAQCFTSIIPFNSHTNATR